MTTSNFSELFLLLGSRELARVGIGTDPSGWPVDVEIDADAADELRVVVRRSQKDARPAQVRLGDLELFTMPSGVVEQEHSLAALAEEYGDSTITYRHVGDEEWNIAPRLSIGLRIRGKKETIDLHERIVREIEAAHIGLAQDVFARTAHRAAAHAAILRPEIEVERLEKSAAEIERALERIGDQPSQALVRKKTFGRPRDAADLVAIGLHRAALRRDHASGRIFPDASEPGWVNRTTPSTDIAEHRHMRRGLESIRRRASRVAEHCQSAVATYARERARWGERGFESKFGGRIDALQRIARRAKDTARECGRIIAAYPFVATAGDVRGRLEPTPIFVNRAGYREAFDTLRRMESSGPLVAEGDDIRLRFRSFPTLFEYWCFIGVVAIVRDILGPPVRDDHGFKVVDEVYRIELEPGQSFRFRSLRGADVAVTYEPDIDPESSRDAKSRWRAAFAAAPLRPDILVTVERPGGRAAVLCMDAKSTAHFDWKRLFSADQTDYRTRVFDPSTGDQPIKQLVFLHRDVGSGVILNLPGYLERRTGSEDSQILGGMAFLPDRTQDVHALVSRFFEIFG
jgi:hypothetical protein